MTGRRWIKPTSRQIATISLLVMLLGGLSWVITTLLHLGDVSVKISYMVFFAGLVILVIMFIALAPYMAHREILTELQKAHEQEIESLKNKLVELLPLEQVAKFQKDNPSQFLTARIDSIFGINKENHWVSANVMLTSRLPYRVEVKLAQLILQLPTSEGKHRYDMRTQVGKEYSVSGGANQRELTIPVHINNEELSGKLARFIGDRGDRWLPLVEGTLIITDRVGKEITLSVPEATIPIFQTVIDESSKRSDNEL